MGRPLATRQRHDSTPRRKHTALLSRGSVVADDQTGSSPRNFR